MRRNIVQRLEMSPFAIVCGVDSVSSMSPPTVDNGVEDDDDGSSSDGSSESSGEVVCVT